MGDTGENIDGAVPRKRPAGGVVGYIAGTAFAWADIDTVELALHRTEPADPLPPTAAAATAPTDAAPTPAQGGTTKEHTLRSAAFAASTIADTVASDGLAGAGTGATASGAASGATESRAGGAEGPGRRRLRGAVLSIAALALIVAAGVGFAALRQAPSSKALPPPIQVPTQPVDPGATFSTGANPGIDPARQADPTVVDTGFFDTSGLPNPAAADPNTPVGGGGGAAGPVQTDPAGRPTYPPKPSWPLIHEPSYPPESTPPPAPEPPSPVDPFPSPSGGLDATIAHTDDAWTLGLGGYSATVTITNPGDSAATGWRVSLTVPGGNKVRKVTGAAVSQDDEDVVFTPKGDATVPAGGSVSFTFQVKGLLADEPTGCAIDGRPCS